MCKMSENKLPMKKQVEWEIVEEASRRLEHALDLKNQGYDAESNQVIEDMKVWVETLLSASEMEGNSKALDTFDRSILPKAGELVIEGSKASLKVLSATEREEFQSEDSFVCSIYDKKTSAYVGYCSIRSLSKRDWEMTIELKPEFCQQGYGTEALSLLMEFLYKVTGRRFFRARVEVDNRASQKMMKKLGAFPNGISEFMLHGEEIERFRMEHKDKITEDIRTVAEEFGMEAEDILGYILEYRFDMEMDRGRKSN